MYFVIRPWPNWDYLQKKIRCPIYSIYKSKDEIQKMKTFKSLGNYRDYFCGLGVGKDVVSGSLCCITSRPPDSWLTTATVYCSLHFCGPARWVFASLTGAHLCGCTQPVGQLCSHVSLPPWASIPWASLLHGDHVVPNEWKWNLQGLLRLTLRITEHQFSVCGWLKQTTGMAQIWEMGK